jgi:transcriptional regulator with XRE-family HTH domain
MEANARKNLQLLMNAVASQGARPVAEACGVDESTVSRWKTAQDSGKPSPWEQFCIALAVLNLKIVPDSAVMVDPKKLDMLLEMSRLWLAGAKPSDLMFSDDG